MKVLFKWLSRLTSILIYGLLICIIALVINSKIQEGTPKVFGYEIMTVLSGSMEPGIKTGSIIAVKPTTDPTKYKKGDIITFKAADNPNILITHRIIDVEKANDFVQYTTKGDNNDSKDLSPVTEGNVVAEYTGFTIPYIGIIMSFIQSKKGAIILLIVPGILMIFWSLYSIWRAISEYESIKEKPVS
ncbi:signal peptidase I SipW [Bacillus sp. FJAT-27245]|uniref:signal peptidase I SipW n=1 Tax=Bacillus sp. FJAT-27245 TaxID=1684144 RepID=UPI0006A75987|nr:signal peptidase I [Bacillus sp. FJAT-27245]